MSNLIDINDKVWGISIKNKFFLIAGAKTAISLLLLVSVIDFIRLPSDSPDEARALIVVYLLIMCGQISFSLFSLVILLCPNKIYYGLIGVVFFFAQLAHTILRIHNNLTTSQTELVSVEKVKLVLKYYPLSIWTFIFGGYLLNLITIYFAGFLFYLGFFYTPKPKVDLYAVQVEVQPVRPAPPPPTTSGASGPSDDKDSDEDSEKEKKPVKECSRRSSKNLKKNSSEKSEKSGKN